LQLGVLFVFLVPFHPRTFGPQLWLLLPAIVVAVLFTVGMCLLVSGLNVRYRDVQHLLEITLLAWFWMTPIVYSVGLVQKHLEAKGLFWLYMANPMTSVITAMQRAIYRDPVKVVDGVPTQVLAADGYGFYLRWLGIAALVSLALVALGLWTFQRLQADFAEEL